MIKEIFGRKFELIEVESDKKKYYCTSCDLQYLCFAGEHPSNCCVNVYFKEIKKEEENEKNK